MRLANGIVIDHDATFGRLLFSALRREAYEQDMDGVSTGVLKHRTYDLKSQGQGCMVQVSIPAEVPLLEIPYNAEVVIINPVGRGIAEANFQGAEANWYFRADDIVIKTAAVTTGNSPSGTKSPDGKSSVQPSADGNLPKKDQPAEKQ